jgi:hypothetical protein
MCLVMAFVGAAAAPVAAQPRESDALIDKIIAAYGERQQVLSVRSYRMEALLRARARGEEADVIRISEGASRLKTLIRYPSSAEIRLLNGRQAWRVGTQPRLGARAPKGSYGASSCASDFAMDLGGAKSPDASH